jgi:hypothetical protein
VEVSEAPQEEDEWQEAKGAGKRNKKVVFNSTAQSEVENRFDSSVITRSVGQVSPTLWPPAFGTAVPRFGPLMKTAIVITKLTTVWCPRFTRIFHGRLRSDLSRSGSRTTTATMQRFDCLQLDIKAKETL